LPAPSGAPTRDASRSRTPWTLRRQLVVLIAGLLLLMSVGLAVASTLALRSNLMNQLDAQLELASERSANLAGGPPRWFDVQQQAGRSGTGESTPRSGSDSSASPTSPSAAASPSTGTASGHPTPGAQIPNAIDAGTIVLTLRDDVVVDGGFFKASGEYQKLSDTQATALRTLARDGAVHTTSLPEIGTVRAVYSTSRDGAEVFTAMSTARVDDSLRSYVMLEGGIAAAVVALATLISAPLVRRSLKPLDRVAEAAVRVSHLPLDRGEVESLPGVEVADTDERTEVGKVGSALNIMLQHVETSLGVRHDSEMQVRQFVADASHELRTPLASIRGYAELVSRSAESVGPETERALERIHSEALRMGGLVEDLLLLARLDAGRPLDEEPVSLGGLAVDAVMDAHAAGPDHVWRLDLPEDDDRDDSELGADTVVGDEPRLRQVFVNLLANARVHTPPGTTVTTSVTALPGSRVRLSVSDDGPGISAELVPTIFQRFTRADTARNRNSGSTGLGLAIVQAIATAHGGTVDVTSRPGRTTFTVELPRSGSSSRPPDTEQG